MQKGTINRLNALNRDFYNTVGSLWNQDPNYYWQGWYELKKYINNSIKTNSIDNKKSLKILDIGCGNGRFGYFLDTILPTDISLEYVGLDFSDTLLFKLNIQSLQTKQRSYQLFKCDLLEDNFVDLLNNQNIFPKFDIIVMFGLIHTIPSQNSRLELFNIVSSILKPADLLIFTTLEYLDNPRLQKRIIDKNDPNNQSIYNQLNLDINDLEEGDNLLEWVKRINSYRYSHAFTPKEINFYLQKADLILNESFCCDGRTMKRNKYYITTKK
jgi:SAM-dependent methyltransferase